MKFEGYKEMSLAMEQARIGAEQGEVPVGAVVIDKNGKVVAASHNKMEQLFDPTAHAEMLVIREVAKKFSDKRLEDYILYVTLEPCAMCAAAISHARIGKLIYAAADKKCGAVENGPMIFKQKTTTYKPEIVSGIMEEESRELLQDFFRELRAGIF
jgi:tRNA(adenine34) deaminase